MEPFQILDSAKAPSLFLLSNWMKRNERLTAGFSGRSGGVSEQPWSSLNMGLHVGDKSEDVIHNRKMVAKALNWPFEAWTCAEQVHGHAVYKVQHSDRGKGRQSHQEAIAGCDAIMTNEPNVLLASYYADCVPLYFYDKENGAVALAHAGWRGTVQEIAARTVEAMHREYGTQMAKLQAAIGPSIGPCCYEVDGEVIRSIEQLAAQYGQDPVQAGWMNMVSKEGKSQIDLKEINRQIMMKAGILPIHIELTEYCTGCSTDLFYSHRIEKGNTGRMASWIGIAEGE